MERKVKKYIIDNNLFTTKDKILIGVSGGRDSMALLHVLYRLGYDIAVAHCNFHLRGEESNRDAEFVAEHVSKMELPFYSIDFDTESYAKANSLSIEMAARNLRYEWFDSMMTVTKSKYTAVAHHLDDVIETFLINIVRGTGIRGLTGIKPKNGTIVRPFLCLTRNEVDDYVLDNRIDYVEDSTNQQNVYVRNKLRNLIIPELKTINPSFANSTRQTIQNLNRAHNFMLYYIEEWKKKIVSNEGSSDIIDTNMLMSAPQPDYLLYWILRPYGFPVTVQNDLFLCITTGNTSGRQFYSPLGKRAVIDRDKIIILDTSTEDNNDEDEQYEIDSVNAIVQYPIRLKISQFRKTSYTIDKSSDVCAVDASKVSFPLILRHWKTGDSFKPLGMKGRNKMVSDYFVDQRVSIIGKKKTWIMTNSDGEIVWIVGMRPDERFKISDDTELVIEFRIDK